MVTKHSDGVRGSGERSVRRKFWQASSRLMEERNGFVNSVPNPVCGRGGSAGAATTTFGTSAEKTLAGETSRGVHGLFDVEWRGGQEV